MLFDADAMTNWILSFRYRIAFLLQRALTARWNVTAEFVWLSSWFLGT